MKAITDLDQNLEKILEGRKAQHSVIYNTEEKTMHLVFFVEKARVYYTTSPIFVDGVRTKYALKERMKNVRFDTEHNSKSFTSLYGAYRQIKTENTADSLQTAFEVCKNIINPKI